MLCGHSKSCKSYNPVNPGSDKSKSISPNKHIEILTGVIKSTEKTEN